MASPLSDVVIQLRELDGLDGIVVRTVPCRVMKLERLAPDVMLLHLRLPMNENMRFVAGQYIELLLKDGVRRAYSIANKPLTTGVIDIELHVRHTPGGLFTDRVFSAMKERELLRFEGPLGTFFLREDSAKPMVFVASGTGFAPIKSMLEYAFDRDIDAARPITLYWGCRAKRDLYMLDLPTRWAAERPNFRFVPVLSDAAARRRVDRPHGLRAPRGDGGLRRSLRPPGVRLRRAADDRGGARRLRRAVRPARPRNSSPTRS